MRVRFTRFPRAPLSAFVLPVLALLVPAGPGCAEAPAVSGSPQQAEREMKTFHDDALHFSYSYPAAYTDASGLVKAAFEASLSSETKAAGGKDLSHCLSLPFSAMSGSDGQLALIALVEDTAACQGKSFTEADLPQLAEDEVQGLAASGGRPQFRKPTSFTFAGHPAEMIRGSFAMPSGQTLQLMAVCVLLEKDVACWQFVAGTEATLRTLGGFPVSLAQKPPAPLVTPALFDRP